MYPRPHTLSSRQARALMLLFQLNADALNYTPGSHKGKRAARLAPKLRAIVEQRT